MKFLIVVPVLLVILSLSLLSPIHARPNSKLVSKKDFLRKTRSVSKSMQVMPSFSLPPPGVSYLSFLFISSSGQRGIFSSSSVEVACDSSWRSSCSLFQQQSPWVRGRRKPFSDHSLAQEWKSYFSGNFILFFTSGFIFKKILPSSRTHKMFLQLKTRRTLEPCSVSGSLGLDCTWTAFSPRMKGCTRVWQTMLLRGKVPVQVSRFEMSWEMTCLQNHLPTALYFVPLKSLMVRLFFMSHYNDKKWVGKDIIITCC